MFSASRDSLRLTMTEAWRKHRSGVALSPLETQIAATVSMHPEYHALLEDPDAVAQDFTPADGQINPFLHLSLHLALHDQISTNRPAGIRAVYEGLRAAFGDEHAAQHQMLERLGEALWQAQHSNAPPDELAYLRAVREDLLRRNPKWREPATGL